MKRNYFMTTERIGFSIWTKEDFKLAKLLWGCPDVTRLICASGLFTDSEVDDRLEFEISNQEKFGMHFALFHLN